jgi:hypothetical protein
MLLRQKSALLPTVLDYGQIASAFGLARKVQEAQMGLYTLIFTETASGQKDHENRLVRRQTGVRRATALGITRPDGGPLRPQDVQEDNSTGVWIYTWNVADPTDQNVHALVGIFNGFGYVTCPGPVPHPRKAG